MPTFESGTFDDDNDHLLSRLAAIGVTQVAVVDLSRPEFEGIAVVRVVIPGLATVVDHPKAAHWDRLPARPALQGARRIGLIDGCFCDMPALTHKEILWARDQGVEVCGAASLGGASGGGACRVRHGRHRQDFRRLRDGSADRL